jgi:SAM-dependent methyltransferase
MRTRPAGDFDYEAGGQYYAAVRRPDPRIAAAIRAMIGEATSLVNVGAGAGSYEPVDLEVTPVEPSAMMRSQRPAHLAPAVDAVADDLPFDDDAFDAGLASFTVHQWPDLAAGLRELRRVTRGPVVVLTADPELLLSFWLGEYAPELIEVESGRMPPVPDIGDLLGGRVVVEPVPLPADCTDGFAEAYFGRPEAFLDERVRRSQSAWGFITPEDEARSVAALRAALDDGSWDARHGHLRTLAEYPGSLRLIRSTPD